MPKIGRFSIYSMLLAAIFLHITVLNYVKIFGAKPDLILMMVIFFALFLGARTGLEIGVVAGLLRDIFAFDLFGVNTVTLAISGLLIGMLNTKFFKESTLTQVILVFSFTIFSMLLHYALSSVLSRYSNIRIFDYFISSIIPNSIYTALLAAPVFSKLIDIYELNEPEDLL